VVDVATAVANDDAVGAVVPPSLTEDKGTYIGASVAFEGVCVSIFADGTGQLGEVDDGESTAGEVGHETATPVNLIVTCEAIFVVVIVIVIVIAVVVVIDSHDVAAEDGVSGAVPPLSSLLSLAAAAAALYLIPRPLNVHRSIIEPSHPDRRFVVPFPYHHHHPPVRPPLPLPSFATSRPC